MASIEERLAYQEAKMEDVSKTMIDLRSAVAALDQKLDRRFDAVDLKFLEVNRRVDGVKDLVVAVLIAALAGLFGVVSRFM